MTHRFISTAIPYVNAPPHIGFALELVIADVIARHDALRGRNPYFLSGTDDNSLKNAIAAQEEGISTRAFVDRGAAQFEALKPLLNLSYGDFLRTSADPRHAPAVNELWNACASNGDVYAGNYEGLYCVGCEQFYTEQELTNGLCPEHRNAPDHVSEANYFFRLSRYQDELIRLIGHDEIAIRPAHRKREVLSFLDSALLDLSISRSVERARRWGVPVPGDTSQIVYVWFDALANYISAAGYASDCGAFERRWTHASRITHVIGKGVIRFHAVYWPAILLSAGLRVPSEILTHGYVTIDGRKISKSVGNTISPHAAGSRYGADALRYYLLRHIGSSRDGDFSWSRYDDVYEHELANDLGNLVSRTTALGRRHGVPEAARSELADALAGQVERHIEEFEIHRALEAIWRVIAAANVYVNRTEPWKLARHGKARELEAVLGELYAALRCIGRTLSPFLPDTAQRMLDALGAASSAPLFPRAGGSGGPIDAPAEARSPSLSGRTDRVTALSRSSGHSR
jgi:methionyl-tRNA synthetase